MVDGTRWTKLLEQMRAAPKNVSFADLEAMAKHIGYSHARTAGSHRIYTCPGRPMLNFQKSGAQAKPYQVRQLLAVIEDFKIEVA
jgi:predicted RNA binding protein YcfA (HicA-like mRNA interferase family)